MKLTNTTIKAMVYEKANNKADLRFDDELRGFGIRVFPSGRKSFFVTYRNQVGTKKRHTIGSYGVFTATEARTQALQLIAKVSQGGDPQAERNERRLDGTFAELAERYIDHVKDHKKSWRDDKQRMRDHVLPSIGARKLSEITLGQLNKLHRSLKRKLSPSTANRVAALIKHTFSMAEKWNLVTDNPARHLTLFREPPPRDIVLSPEQCRGLVRACDEDSNPHAAALFKLAMFTGRRIGEWQNAKWAELDIEHGRLTLPDTKAGERQFVYLSEPAIVILRNLPRKAGNPHIIAGDRPGKPINFYRRAWNRILVRADIEPFPPHGLRHNYASMLVAQGVPLTTVGQLLGHKNASTTLKYAHHRPDQLRDAAQVFQNVIELAGEREKRQG